VDTAWVKENIGQDIFISETNVMAAKAFGWEGEDFSKGWYIKSEWFATNHSGDEDTIAVKDKIGKKLTNKIEIEMKGVGGV
jgi:hypothetical protein